MPSDSLSFIINTSRLPDGCLVFRFLARWFGSNELTLKEGHQKKQAFKKHSLQYSFGKGASTQNFIESNFLCYEKLTHI